MSRAGCACCSSRWLAGPRPCRFTATDPGLHSGSGTSPGSGSTSSTMPRSRSNRPVAAGPASTSLRSGNRRRTPRRAATPVKASPKPRARSTRTSSGPGVTGAAPSGPDCSAPDARPGRRRIAPPCPAASQAAV
ncbi:hypothetical protein ACFFX0_04330 [Citricoccus parietis]|uniref:Uncharacterized protein n=1 Tax=Citricoccus parietis TaxID=592307 RepID=A0ABV5FUU6_9MICC